MTLFVGDILQVDALGVTSVVDLSIDYTANEMGTLSVAASRGVWTVNGTVITGHTLDRVSLAFTGHATSATSPAIHFTDGINDYYMINRDANLVVSVTGVTAQSSTSPLLLNYYNLHDSNALPYTGSGFQVYGFFHSVFQEYFIATVVLDDDPHIQTQYFPGEVGDPAMSDLPGTVYSTEQETINNQLVNLTYAVGAVNTTVEAFMLGSVTSQIYYFYTATGTPGIPAGAAYVGHTIIAGGAVGTTWASWGLINRLNVETGDADNETLQGTLGRDRLTGQNGIDRLYGDWADDLLFGGGMTDSLYGGKPTTRWMAAAALIRCGAGWAMMC